MPISGPWWASQFPTSDKLTDLDLLFQQKVVHFIHALKVAHAHVSISATRRPRQRAYLMHYSWCIWKRWKGITADKVPAYHPKATNDSPVDIQWLHRTPRGEPDLHSSRAAAGKMVSLYEMSNLHVPPAYDPKGHHDSRHVEGKALDMTISWHGTLKIMDAKGNPVEIASNPRSSTNPALIEVGASYGVIHFLDVHKDQPHWSVDGH